MKQESGHYSYAVYADPAMAEQFERRRFGGPIGSLVAETQEGQIADALSPVTGLRILDVGTGTGRAALALARRGAIVTGIDASVEMLRVAGQKAVEQGQAATFRTGDVHALAFDDRQFDAVVCLRLLMHVPDWRLAMRELCRVADRHLVFDYPAASSAAAVESAFRTCAHIVNRRVEAYRVFRAGAIASALAQGGFRIQRRHRQFVLPIALHKRVNSERWTRRVEGAFGRMGLQDRFGSPVTIVAERCAS